MSSSPRVLVIGGAGMLGHKLAQVLGESCAVAVSIRGNADSWPAAIGVERVFGGSDVRDTAAMAALLEEWKPAAVLNAAGVIKQIMDGQDPLDTMAVNGLFPNQLALLCEMRGVRLVHYSTDCVFTGKPEGERGPDGYREDDPADSRDLYGMSKLLGEPRAPTTLVLRTSIIGRELRGFTSLLEWFLTQDKGPIKGYTQAFFTGLTTLELSRVTARILHHHPDMTGLWHVAAPAITKFRLLQLAGEIFEKDVRIEPFDGFYCDRRLDGARFAATSGWSCPPWAELLRQLRDDPFETALSRTFTRRKTA